MANDSEQNVAPVPPEPSRWYRWNKWGNEHSVVVSVVLSVLAIVVSTTISSMEVGASFNVEDYRQQAQSYREIVETEGAFNRAYRKLRSRRLMISSIANGCLRSNKKCDLNAIELQIKEWRTDLERLEIAQRDLIATLEAGAHLWREDTRGFAKKVELLHLIEMSELTQAELIGASKGISGPLILDEDPMEDQNQDSIGSMFLDAELEDYVKQAYGLKRALANELATKN